MKIAVLAGGLSPERDVSLTSGSLIATSLSRSGHAVALVDLYLGLKKIPKDIESLFVKGESYSYKVETAEPDLEALIASNGGRRAPIGEGVLDICRAATDSSRQRVTATGSKNTPEQATSAHFFRWIRTSRSALWSRQV